MSLSSHRATAMAARSRAAGPGSAAEAGAAVEVLHLRKAYGATVAVDDVSFCDAEGEIFGILGPNGAGKTTTVECVIGLRSPGAGDIRALGLDPQVDREELHASAGVQLQAGVLPARRKAGEILDLLQPCCQQAADLEELVDSRGLAEKKNEYCRSLSGGLEQRRSIALALTCYVAEAERLCARVANLEDAFVQMTGRHSHDEIGRVHR